MPKSNQNCSRDERIKTEFNIDEIESAVQEIAYARLVQNWSGCLKLESDCKHIILSQFADGSSWTKGYHEIYRIEDYESWSDFILDMDDNFLELSNKKKWEFCDVNGMLDDQIEQAQQRLDEVAN